MAKELEIFFSNRLEILYEQLKKSLFHPSVSTPLMRRLVVVYGPAMKSWLMLKMAQDPDLHIAMGIEFLTLNQAFDTLLKFSTTNENSIFPSIHELAWMIEKEIYDVMIHFQHFSHEEQKEWKCLLHYLKVDPFNFHPSFFSKKMEKRLIGLSFHLSQLFQIYGRFASAMIDQWNSSKLQGWQPLLWKKIFNKESEWTYSTQALLQNPLPKEEFSVHFFSISFLTVDEFQFLARLSKQNPVYYYLLSPCAVFWSDIKSDRERFSLQRYWHKKLGSFSPQATYLEELLGERNPLLANFGRMGREMVCQIEESLAITEAKYLLPEHVKELGEEIFFHEDLFFSEEKSPLTLLHAIQADLLMMRAPQHDHPFELSDSKSIQLHIVPNRRREVEILYHNLLHLISSDPSLYPGEIIVMAPQIQEYVPYIETVFGSQKSQLDFQVLDLEIQLQNEIAQGFLQLIELSESRWNSNALIQLFDHPSFQRKHQLTKSDQTTIREWVKQTAIYWGENTDHRNAILKEKHCQSSMVDSTIVGTWEYGISRLLMGLTNVFEKQSSLPLEIAPYEAIDFSQTDLLGRWIELLHSLRDDLSPLEDRTRMTIEEWGNFLICLLESYFQPNFDDSKSLNEYEDIKNQLNILRSSARHFKETVFSFTSVKSHLLLLLQQGTITYREDRLNAVRFCSLVPLRSIPAKVIAMMGMEEGAFPRTEHRQSLNLMMNNHDVHYCPMSSDYDRYLFLEALHAAQNYILFSYQGYHPQEGRDNSPSLVIEELFSYCDQYYTISGKKVSEVCIVQHPYDSFDAKYFKKENGLFNYSMTDYKSSKIFYKEKKKPHCFIEEFYWKEDFSIDKLANHEQINIRHLSAVVRNPIKFTLNQLHEIYLQTEEDRIIQDEEEIQISSLEKHLIIKEALSGSIENVLAQAEREGKLPLGIFNTLSKRHLKDEHQKINEQLLKHAINPCHLFQIEFCTSCPSPVQLKEDHWLFPAVSLTLDGGKKISIVGKLPQVSSKGLVVLSKGSLTDAWKIWPQYLLYCQAVKLFPSKLESRLIFANGNHLKTQFFEDSELYLKKLIHYYAFCLDHFSPLLPDWIPLILNENIDGLQNKIKDIFGESFGLFQSPELRWFLNRYHLPSAEHIIQHWKYPCNELAGAIQSFWFTKQEEKV